MATGINDGGTIFPTTVSREEGGNTLTVPANGLSIRDWFAGQAVATLIDISRGDNTRGRTYPEHVARQAYQIADAMLKARES